MSAERDTAGERRRYATLAAATVVLLAVGWAILPQDLRGDDAVREVMIRQLRSGVEPDTKYSFVQPAVSLPVYTVLRALGFGVCSVMAIPTVWVVAWAATAWRLLARARGARFAYHAVLLTLVSLIGASVVGFGSDVFSALGVSGGLLAGTLARGPLARSVGWFVVVVAAANTPPMAVAAGVIGVVVACEHRRVRYLLLGPAVLLAMAVESTAVTGEPSLTRYSRAVEHGDLQLLPWGDVSGFGWPLWSGLLAVLFSFGRGLVFYVPTLWHGPSRGAVDALRVAEWSLWIGGCSLVPLYATWWAWYGGVGFGPRFFMVLVPAAALGTAAALERQLAPPGRSGGRGALLAASVALAAWVTIAGALYGVTSTAFEACVSGGTFANEALCLYTPEYSGLWAPIWAADPVGVRGAVFAAVVVLVCTPALVALGRRLWPSLRAALRRGRALAAGPWRP